MPLAALAAKVLSSVVSAVSYILTQESSIWHRPTVSFFLHVSGFQALISKTLDQASAQFAASALVTTDQLLACKSKEDPVPVVTSGVNGILPGAGE